MPPRLRGKTRSKSSAAVRTIHKFTAPPPGGSCMWALGDDPKVVHVGQQDGHAFLWIEHDAAAPITPKLDFGCFGTGWDIPPGYEHVGTYLNGAFVWHVYQRRCN